MLIAHHNASVESDKMQIPTNSSDRGSDRAPAE